MIRFAAITTTSALLLAAGCGGGDDGDSGSGAAQAPSEEAAMKEKAGGGKEARAANPRAGEAAVTVKTAGSDFGRILFDGDDQAIYLFDKEKSDRSECYGACAAAWPPVLTKGAPRAGGGVRTGLLGTTKRDDGTTQVTYNGHPLYYYVDDGPGEVLCNDVNEFGGLWLVVGPGGEPVS